MDRKPIILAALLLAAPLCARDDDFPYYAAPSYAVMPSIRPPEYHPYVQAFDQTFEGAWKGDFIQKPTFMNIVGNILANLTPLSLPSDLRDVSANFQKSYKTNFTEYKKDVGLSVLAIAPAFGEFKKVKAIVEMRNETKAAAKLAKSMTFAPAIESGIKRELQRAIVDSAREGEIIAVRARAYGANFLDGKLPAKPAVFEGISFKNGVRQAKDGTRVISDLDLAFVIKNGKPMSETHALNAGYRINRNYGFDVVMHGDNYSGARRGIEKAVYIETKGTDVVYLFNNKGFLDSGEYNIMINKHMYRR